MNDDDDLLQALGKLARERESEAARPDVWSRLARGELSARELAELEARAASDETLEPALRAYRPLPGEARERIADALFASLPAPDAARQGAQIGTPVAAAAPPAPAAAALPVAAAPAAAAAAPPAVVSLDAHRRRRLALVASPLAAAFAAAAALWLFVASPAGGPDVAPLPAYELVARGGVKHTRGPAEPPAAGPLRLVPGSEIDLTLRPATRVEGPLAVRAFAVQRGEARPWPAPVEIAPTGAMRLHGPADKLLAGFEGSLELRLVVGRAEAVGAEAEAREKALGHATAGPGWQVARVGVELIKSP